jgi:hypothetical protein
MDTTEPAAAAEHAPADPGSAEVPLALPSPSMRESRTAVGVDLYRSANRRLVFGPLCGVGAGAIGLGAMAVWSPDFRFVSVAAAVPAEGLATSSLLLLASGVQMQRRSQMALGAEPEANPWFTAGLALGGGALLAGLAAPAALSTEDRPLIYGTTGTAAALGLTSMATLIVANVVEVQRTSALVRAAKTGTVTMSVGGSGVAGTF